MSKVVRFKKTEYLHKAYNKLEMARLILYSIYSVMKNGEICTYERLVAECFQKFPQIFGFKRYPHWPDSLKFDRPLRTLREKGLIIGSVRDHFELTEFGRKVAIETENILTNRRIKISVPKPRSVDEKFIEYIKESEQFKKFLNNPDGLNFSDVEFRSLLRCTLETPERVLKQNLAYYKNIAKIYNEEQILEFLALCEKKFIKKGGKNG